MDSDQKSQINSNNKVVVVDNNNNNNNNNNKLQLNLKLVEVDSKSQNSSNSNKNQVRNRDSLKEDQNLTNNSSLVVKTKSKVVVMMALLKSKNDLHC